MIRFLATVKCFASCALYPTASADVSPMKATYSLPSLVSAHVQLPSTQCCEQTGAVHTA